MTIKELLKTGQFEEATREIIPLLMSKDFIQLPKLYPIEITPYSSLVQMVWSNCTMEQILSVAEREYKVLCDNPVDDTDSFSPDLTSAVECLISLKMSPKGGLDWTGQRAGFWFRSHIIIILVSLATIPPLRSYCPHSRDDLHQMLILCPGKAFEAAWKKKLMGIGPISKKLFADIKAMSMVKKGVDQFLYIETWRGASLCLLIASKIAKDQDKIIAETKLEYLLYSIYVNGEGKMDYSDIMVQDQTNHLSIGDAQNHVRRLIDIAKKLSPLDALETGDLTTLQTLIEEKEGRCVFELVLCSVALAARYCDFLDEKDRTWDVERCEPDT